MEGEKTSRGLELFKMVDMGGVLLSLYFKSKIRGYGGGGRSIYFSPV